MTVEEKAKLYDRALEIAKKNYDTVQDLSEGYRIDVECFKNILECIFPNLKESKDNNIFQEVDKYWKTFDYSHNNEGGKQ